MQARIAGDVCSATGGFSLFCVRTCFGISLLRCCSVLSALCHPRIVFGCAGARRHTGGQPNQREIGNRLPQKFICAGTRRQGQSDGQECNYTGSGSNPSRTAFHQFPSSARRHRVLFLFRRLWHYAGSSLNAKARTPSNTPGRLRLTISQCGYSMNTPSTKTSGISIYSYLRKQFQTQFHNG
jgi:hypothetical protein